MVASLLSESSEKRYELMICRDRTVSGCNDLTHTSEPDLFAAADPGDYPRTLAYASGIPFDAIIIDRRSEGIDCDAINRAWLGDSHF